MKLLRLFVLLFSAFVAGPVAMANPDPIPLPPDPGANPNLPLTLGVDACVFFLDPTQIQDADVVEWTKDGEVFVNPNEHLLLLTPVSEANSGIYSASVVREGEVVQSSGSWNIWGFRFGTPSNVSARHFVDASQEAVAIAGFVIDNGEHTTPVLLRAITNSLTTYGVTNPATLESVRLLDSVGNLVLDFYVPISGETNLLYSEKEVTLGAFPSGEGDWVEWTNLRDGAYTLVATPAEGTSGTVLLELYFENNLP